MAYQVTLNIPEVVYQRAEQAAATQHQPLEEVLVNALTAYWLADLTADEGVETDIEKRALVAPGIETADWWNAEGDKEWDTWQP